ncbi:MAG: PH domain-containing protein [Anaerolineae bacterium]|nr:PH domain-containing protein [Anaerolineae bacterium]
MGYVEKAMGDNERILYRTHQHVIVLFLRVFASLFAFLVFLAVGLTVLLASSDESGDQVRFVIGLIALGSLVMPGYLIVSAWLEGLRGEDLVKSIWRAALAGVAILVFSLVMMLIPSFKLTGALALVVAVVPAAEVIRILLDWWNERYIITNRRVMEVRGTINKNVRDSALEKVNDVELNQSIVGRVLGYGTVEIITGSDIGVNEFHRISNPVRFKREMLNAKESYRMAGPDPDEETKPSPTAPARDAEPSKGEIPDLIAELDELRQKGIISEEEFQAKKTELLARL